MLIIVQAFLSKNWFDHFLKNILWQFVKLVSAKSVKLKDTTFNFETSSAFDVNHPLWRLMSDNFILGSNYQIQLKSWQLQIYNKMQVFFLKSHIDFCRYNMWIWFWFTKHNNNNFWRWNQDTFEQNILAAMAGEAEEELGSQMKDCRGATFWGYFGWVLSGRLRWRTAEVSLAQYKYTNTNTITNTYTKIHTYIEIQIQYKEEELGSQMKDCRGVTCTLRNQFFHWGLELKSGSTKSFFVRQLIVTWL